MLDIQRVERKNWLTRCPNNVTWQLIIRPPAVWYFSETTLLSCYHTLCYKQEPSWYDLNKLNENGTSKMYEWQQLSVLVMFLSFWVNFRHVCWRKMVTSYIEGKQLHGKWRNIRLISCHLVTEFQIQISKNTHFAGFSLI